MKSMTYDNDRLITEIRVKHNGKVSTFNNIEIDTGSPHSYISPETAATFNISDKEIELDSLSIGPLKVASFTLHVAPCTGDGIIGVDFLKKVGARLSFDSMIISSTRT